MHYGLIKVPRGGIEPPHPLGYTILSRMRLPVPPPRQVDRSERRRRYAVPTGRKCYLIHHSKATHHERFTQRSI